jgi:tetratricopeptide (TPR) repeat protein
LDVSGDHRVARALAHKSLGTVATMRSRWADVRAHADALATVGSQRDVRAAALARGAAYEHGPFPYSVLLRFCDEQLARTDLTPTHRGMTSLAKANAVAALGRPDWRSLLDEADAVLASIPSPPYFAHAERGEITYNAGRHLESIRHYGLLVERVHAVGQDSLASTYQGWRVCVALHARVDHPDVVAWLEEAESWSEDYDVTTMTVVHTGRAILASRAGDHAEALRRARAALEYAESSDALRHRADARTWLAEVWRRAGETGEERRQLELAVAEYRQKEALVLAAHAEGLLSTASA